VTGRLFTIEIATPRFGAVAILIIFL